MDTGHRAGLRARALCSHRSPCSSAHPCPEGLAGLQSRADPSWANGAASVICWPLSTSSNAGLNYPEEGGISSLDVPSSPESGHKQNLNN